MHISNSYDNNNCQWGTEEEIFVEVNEALPVRQGRGRPVGARGRCGKYNVSTRRDPSAFEHVLLQTQAVQKPDAVSNLNEQGRGRFKGQQILSNSQPPEQTPPCQNLHSLVDYVLHRAK